MRPVWAHDLAIDAVREHLVVYLAAYFTALNVYEAAKSVLVILTYCQRLTTSTSIIKPNSSFGSLMSFAEISAAASPKENIIASAAIKTPFLMAPPSFWICNEHYS